ncbi:MAG: peptidoglycan-binding domain-containing protein, partial [Parvibaculum sp.]
TEHVGAFPSFGTELARDLEVVRPEGAAAFAWMAHDLNRHGVVGDARLATTEMGRMLVEGYGAVLAAIVRDARAFPLDRAATAEAQVRLLRLGYAPGAPTGRLSVRTRQAIALFQKNAGLDVTGAIDTSTIELLRRASAS